MIFFNRTIFKRFLKIWNYLNFWARFMNTKRALDHFELICHVIRYRSNKRFTVLLPPVWPFVKGASSIAWKSVRVLSKENSFKRISFEEVLRVLFEWFSCSKIRIDNFKLLICLMLRIWFLEVWLGAEALSVSSFGFGNENCSIKCSKSSKASATALLKLKFN